MNVTDTTISAPVISDAVRVTNGEAIVRFDPQDEENADQFLVEYYAASNLNTANKVLASYIKLYACHSKKTFMIVSGQCPSSIHCINHYNSYTAKS